MRISDWSSDVCSSDLSLRFRLAREAKAVPATSAAFAEHAAEAASNALKSALPKGAAQDRKSVVEGKSVSVRVDLGGRRIIQQNNTQYYYHGNTVQRLTAVHTLGTDVCRTELMT